MNGAERAFARTDFDALYAGAADPYGTHGRWYERRKRDLLLAALPRPRFARAFEPGCGVGALTAALAPRCDALLASDATTAAVQAARRHAAPWPHVRVERQVLPDGWPPTPQGGFDLIVLGELGYFLEPLAWAAVARCCADSLAADGVLAACDWRRGFEGRIQPTAQVHAALDALGLAPLARYDDADFSLRLWARDGRSVAQREGIAP